MKGQGTKPIKEIPKLFNKKEEKSYLTMKKIPLWMVANIKIDTATNEQKKNQAQSYRPIALQNNMYKVYTAILAEFIMDHCQENNIITEEHAAGKRGSWGCTDQLLK